MIFGSVSAFGTQKRVKYLFLTYVVFSSHWEVGSSMNCLVTEGGGGGGGAEEVEAEQENSHFLQ